MHLPYFDWDIQPIHLEIIRTLAAIFGAGLAGAIVVWWNEWRGRAFDRWLVSRTLVSDVSENGTCLLQLRNYGGTEKLEDKVHGRKIRNAMVKSARKTSLDQPYIVLPTDTDQSDMYHAALNALTWINAPGQAAEDAGLPVNKTWMYFSVTGVDADDEKTVRMFRIQFNDEATLRRFYKTNHRWSYELGQVEHETRTRTLAKMADAYFDGGGRLVIDGRSVQVIGRMELKVPA